MDGSSSGNSGSGSFSIGTNALGAALALADESSSLVVLQGDYSKPATVRLRQLSAAFVERFLVGQQSVCILLQQPDETLPQLQERVRDRLASLECPARRLLWITPDDAPGQHLLRHYASLTQHCAQGLEVLLVAGPQLMVVHPFSITETWRGREDTLAPRAPTSGQAGATVTRPRSAPPDSAVVWAQPEGAPAPVSSKAT